MVTIAMIGDSTVNTGLSLNSTANKYLPGYLYTSGGFMFDNVLTYGNGGDDLSDILARTDTALADSWDIGLLQGGINDLTVTSLDDMKSAMLEIASKVRLEDRHFVPMTVLPRLSGLDDEMLAKRIAFNDWLLSEPTGERQLFSTVIDLTKTSYETEAFGPNRLAVSIDGIHPMPIACRDLMKETLSQINAAQDKLVPFGNALGYADYAVNSEMFGIDGLVTGVVSGASPNGWRVHLVQSGTETATSSVVRGDQNENRLRVDLSGAPSGIVKSMLIYPPKFPLPANGKVRTRLSVRGAGLQGVVGIQTVLRVVAGGGTTTINAWTRAGSDEDGDLLPEDFENTYFSEPVDIPADVTADQSEVRIIIYFRDNADLSGFFEVWDLQVLAA